MGAGGYPIVCFDKGVEFDWSAACQEAFLKLKELLSEARTHPGFTGVGSYWTQPGVRPGGRVSQTCCLCQ